MTAVEFMWFVVLVNGSSCGLWVLALSMSGLLVSEVLQVLWRLLMYFFGQPGFGFVTDIY